MTSEEIKAQSEWAIKYNRCCKEFGGGSFITFTEKIYALIEDHRKTKHALWMARADRAKTECEYYSSLGYFNCLSSGEEALWVKWSWVERKCRAKAKEFE